MFGVGIDVAKSKSMVAILSDDGEIVNAPFEIANTESGLSFLCSIIKELEIIKKLRNNTEFKRHRALL